ncbi:hypothetical protein ACFSTD_23975 [Novosphingobium colocasiae]
MTQPAFAVPVPVPLAAAAPSATSITLTPQDRPQNRGRRAVLSAILSLAVIAVVLHEMGGIALGGVLAMVPATPLFWAAFAASYLASPVSEWLIFFAVSGAFLPPGSSPCCASGSITSCCWDTWERPISTPGPAVTSRWRQRRSARSRTWRSFRR